MPIILPSGLTPEQIRVLQEYRRLNAETLSLETIRAIRIPSGESGETAAAGLVASGYLGADDAKENFALTQKGKDFLAIEAKPDVPEPADSGTAPAAKAAAEGS